MSKCKNVLKIKLFLLAAIVFYVDLAYCLEQIYYSVQFATLRNLSDVNKQINSIKEKGQIVFWEKTELSDMGLFYRVYVGKYRKWDDALAFRDKLKKAGFEGHLGIQWFFEKVAPQGERTFPESVKPDKPSVIPELLTTISPDRFVDNQDGTISDRATNLMWIKNGWRVDFISAVTWFEAMEKCKVFRLGNYANWRLPTIAEWVGLIDSNQKNPAIIEPNPFVNIITHMPYWTQSMTSYSQAHIYTILLYSGSIQKQNKNDLAFIMPVRSIGAQ
jgi:hypothetical protein